jgi:hypothetical protein
MNDKSHASLEQHVCLVRGKAFDTGAILLDKRLRASMEHHTATGWVCAPSTGSFPMTASSRWSNAIHIAAVRRPAGA